ncbi:MAG: lamin tail domain-containing protein [Bacteroidota bacterium]|nr:lamin tail domain-containing protein [Candidatus Kapabacteria bacterium]MDW8271385.1 lamin tail domain-containing protein [Bacteroidota bacterium]
MHVLLWAVFPTLYIAWSQVVINEVQPVPPTGEPEWVELFNPADTDVTLTNLYLYDRTARVLLSGVTVPARGFAILTRDTDDLKLSRRIPPIARLYQLSLPTLNNTTESIFIATRDTTVLDSVYYDMRWGVRGRTLERVDAKRPGYLRDNIAACIAPDSATCGYDNSVSIIERDIAVRSIVVEDGSVAWIELANRGRSAFSQLAVLLRLRRPSWQWWIELGTITFDYIPPASTSQQRIDLTKFPALVQLGYGQFLLQAIAQASDLRSWNDTAAALLFVPFPPGTVVFNEIMYDPSDGRSEYIELVNPTPDTLYLGGLLLGDANPPQSAIPGIVLPPGELVTFALDTAIWTAFPELRGSPCLVPIRSSWTLSNSGETLLIANPDGSVVDSVPYDPSWHFWGLKLSKGRSLEKLRPDLPSSDNRSWSSATADRGGTPCSPNSIIPRDSLRALLMASPNPFSPTSADPRLHQTMIRYRLPWQSARVTVRIFNANGIPIRELANGMYSGAEGVLLWDGRNSEGFAVGAGVYVVLLEATDALSSETVHERTVVVIGK